MTLGGRLKEAGIGHRAFNVSIRHDIYNMLKKVSNRSEFIENRITPVLKQMDPGPSCGFLKGVDEFGTYTLKKAILDKDFEKVIAIASMMHELRDYRALCCPETFLDKKSCEDAGGKWKNGVCTVDTFDEINQVSKVYTKDLRAC
jgi:hypothetical protein